MCCKIFKNRLFPEKIHHDLYTRKIIVLNQLRYNFQNRYLQFNGYFLTISGHLSF